MEFDVVVRGGTAVFPHLGVMPADIAIRGGLIAAILKPGETIGGARATIDANGLHVFPGLIDAHVHFGFAEPVTEYGTETFYAAQGGIASIVAYFLNNEPYGPIFAKARAECEARAFVDFGFHVSTATQTHLDEMGKYGQEFGVTSFKYFMNFKGEAGRYMGLDGTDDGFFLDLLTSAGELKWPLIVCHTENIEMVNRITNRFIAAGKSTLREYCLSKPPITESENLLRAMYIAEQTRARIYSPHVSCKAALDVYRRWGTRGVEAYLETCPHYLTHTMDSDLGTIARANPPLRAQEDVDALWRALADGTIQVLASDHVPRKRATKMKTIWQASQGFPGTAMILPVALSEGYHKGRLSLQRIAQVVGSEPARIFNLAPRKGDIRIGADGDLTIVDLDKVRKVDPVELGSYSDYSPYEGWPLKGWPVRTIVRGVTVMKDHRIVGPAGHGRYMRRDAA
jgi:dihydropyrimidinase